MSPPRLATLAALLIALALPVAAQQLPCADRDTVIERLASEFAEHPVALGIANDGSVVEVLSSATRGGWTLIVTRPDGTACMIAAGENWEAIPKIASFDPTA